MIRALRAGDRYQVCQDGIVTWSCFASGPHYHPDNVAFGPLVALDEHVLAPGAGFAEHAHRGVDLVTVVLAGTLRHEDDRGTVRLLTPGAVQMQHAGGGLRHAETNPSDSEPLRMIQMALLSEDERSGSEIASLPVMLGGATLVAMTGATWVPPGLTHLHVIEGRLHVGGLVVGPGDTVRADEPVELKGSGCGLLWTFATPNGD